MQPIEVIDTAVKVGLGALISGYTTYKITKLNQNSDSRKEHQKRLHEALIKITEMIDTYEHALSSCVSKIDGILRQGNEPGQFPESHFENYGESDMELINARPILAGAISRLGLLGFDSAKVAAESLFDLENEFRLLIVFDNKLPNADQLQTFRTKLKNTSLSILNELSKTYKRELG